MKQKLFKNLSSVVSALAILISVAYAQTGKIAGKVSDKATSETLIGLTVGIDGTTKGTSTDIEGRYTLILSPGTYTLTFRYIGYQTKTITGVVVNEGKVSNLDVIVEEAATQSLNEVVVTATYKQESVGALYAQQKNAISISSGIVADQIRKSPDKNTSEVLKRVSGASIQDGKFIVIRGLSDRYNNALLNNALLPSSEPDKKAFSFDIIPSNMVDKIIISKTANADMPGDFAGGITQIITKDIPDKNYFGVAITTGYNSQTTFKNFVSNGRNSTDFLGFDDGSRSIPEQFPSSRNKYNNNSTTITQKINNTKLFDNPFGTVNTTAAPIQSYQFNYGRLNTFKNEGVLGSIISLSYRNGQTLVDASRETFDGVENNFLYNDKIYKYNTTLGALANFAYKKGKSKYSFKNLFNQTFDDSYIDRTGFNINQGNILYSGSELNQKTLINSQIEGEHRIGKNNAKLEWNLNYSMINRKQPDLRNILYNQSGNSEFSLADNFTRRFFSDLQENIFGGSSTYALPFNLFEKKSTLKFGVLKQVRQREFNSRNFLYQPATQDFDQSKLKLPKELIFNRENISRTGFVFNEITNNPDSYSGYSDLNAGFVMLDNQFSNKWRFVWGVRLENYAQDIDAIGNSGLPIVANQSFFDILPSFNLTYNLTEKTNLRLSGSQTVSRPELRELAPFVFINQEENTQTSGNPLLKRSNNTNADVRFEYYPNSGEAFTTTLFYKNFKNPIEQIVASSSTYSNLSFNFNNVNSAYSYGIEFDFRKNLGFIASSNNWLKNFTAGANLTLINSEVNLNNNTSASKRPLQGQSPYLINGSLQYNSPKSGFTINTLYNRVGKRIVRVGNENIPDFYENGRDLLDFQISKKILKNKGEIRLNIGDIFNQNQIIYQNYNQDKNYNKQQDTEFFRFKSGTTYTIGLTYDFSFAN